MAILVDINTRILCQGVMGDFGSCHAKASLDYGTKLVAGVTPGKGGQSFDYGSHKVPVFDTLSQAAKELGATVSVIFLPSPLAADAILKAVEFMVMEGVLLTSAGLASFLARHRDLLCRADLITMWRRCRILLSIHNWHHLSDFQFQPLTPDTEVERGMVWR